VKESPMPATSSRPDDARPMPAPSDNRIVYEQPLSERIRAFLRLEFLFERARHQLRFDDAWSSRTTLEIVIDVMSVLGRTDLKKEIIKELERQAATLDSLARNPAVDPARLDDVLGEVRGVLATLHSQDQPPGHELRFNELLSTVRQRASIPAGACHFDLPAFHFWLARPAEERLRDLHEWLSTFNVLRDAVALCLRLVRESAVATDELAESGFFQRNLSTATPCQMIRVALPRDAPVYPEISAGKHRFTIRFMNPGDASTRPTQSDSDVPFELLCCVI